MTLKVVDSKEVAVLAGDVKREAGGKELEEKARRDVLRRYGLNQEYPFLDDIKPGRLNWELKNLDRLRIAREDFSKILPVFAVLVENNMSVTIRKHLLWKDAKLLEQEFKELRDRGRDPRNFPTEIFERHEDFMKALEILDSKKQVSAQVKPVTNPQIREQRVIRLQPQSTQKQVQIQKPEKREMPPKTKPLGQKEYDWGGIPTHEVIERKTPFGYKSSLSGNVIREDSKVEHVLAYVSYWEPVQKFQLHLNLDFDKGRLGEARLLFGAESREFIKPLKVSGVYLGRVHHDSANRVFDGFIASGGGEWLDRQISIQSGRRYESVRTTRHRETNGEETEVPILPIKTQLRSDGEQPIRNAEVATSAGQMSKQLPFMGFMVTQDSENHNSWTGEGKVKIEGERELSVSTRMFFKRNGSMMSDVLIRDIKNNKLQVYAATVTSEGQSFRSGSLFQSTLIEPKEIGAELKKFQKQAVEMLA